MLTYVRRYPPLVFALVLLMIFVGLAIAGQFFVHFDPLAIDFEQKLCPISSTHWLGCDIFGRDLAAQLMKGAATTLLVALMTICLSMSVGITYGMLAGYVGGWVDIFMMSLVDIFMSFPGILLALAIAAILGPRLENVVFAIAATGWTAPARLARGQVLSLKERDYVTASRSLGASHFYILRKDILPFLAAPLLVLATFSVSGVILVEASLSFLGVGAPPSHPTWGTMLQEAKGYLSEAPILSVVPGAAIALVVLAFNILGDTLRDIFDPKNITQAR
jgi:ABC-type dipeptide/oligopeptide/nickel transport system permease subunit